jgi:DNA-binding XRE family transcriptional regulator
MLLVPHEVYFDHNYLPVLRNDLRNARSSIKIHDPYLTDRAIQELLFEIAPRIGNPLCVCGFIQKPRGWDEREKGTLLTWQQASVDKIAASCKLMMDMRCHINVRKNIHEKIMTIDDEIAWEGSLNFLSHYETTERLNRWVGRAKVEEIRMSHKLDECEHCHGQLANRGLLLREGDGSEYAVDSRRRRLGEQIAARRKFMSLSQEQLAKEIGTDRKTLSAIETGARNASADLLTAVGARIGLELIYVESSRLVAVENVLNPKQSR